MAILKGIKTMGQPTLENWIFTAIKFAVLTLGFVNLLVIRNKITALINGSYTVLEFMVILFTIYVFVNGTLAVLEDNYNDEMAYGLIIVVYRWLREFVRYYNYTGLPIATYENINYATYFGVGCLFCGYLLHVNWATPLYSYRLDLF